MKKSSKEIDHAYKIELFNNIDFSGYDLPEPRDFDETMSQLFDVFKSEYSHEIARRGNQGALREWLMGLPSVIHVEFMNHKIIEQAILFGSLDDNATEKQKDKLLDNY